MRLPPGTRLGAYEIVGLLGTGGMGEVYRALDSRLGREVAVKVLGRSLSANPDALARFEGEARAASALNHPHILHVYDVGNAVTTEVKAPYMVTELVRGRTLREKIYVERAGLDALLEQLVQAADALAKAHAAGIVHRDLKPDNIMITDDGYAKIIDFGLAKLAQPLAATGVASDTDASGSLDTVLASPLSRAGGLMGTVGYVAPEQLLGGDTDARVDVFAFGCVLYETATGCRAFEGDSTVDTLHAILHAKPKPLSSSWSGATDELQRIVDKCLEKAPVDRYQKMTDLVADLKGLRRAAEAGSAPRRPIPTVELRTLAVLPFEDLSPEHDHEWFSDGLTEEIITTLSKIRSVRVISRSSVMHFKGKRLDLPSVAAALRATHVLEGSVRKAGDRVRITAQLVEARDDTHLWADRYDGTLADIFDIQERVARSIAQELAVKLSTEENIRIGERAVPDAKAYECLLRARAATLQFSRDGLERALQEIGKARELVGENAALLEAQGYVEWMFYNAGIDPVEARLEHAESCAQRIFQLEPESGRGHRIAGLVAVQRQDPRGAIRHLRKTLEVFPEDADTTFWLSVACALTGRNDAARDRATGLLRVDPLNALAHMVLGVLEWMEGKLENALQRIQKFQELDPNNVFGLLFQGMVLAASGRNAEACDSFVEYRRRFLDHPFAAVATLYELALRGDAGGVRAAITPELLQMMGADLQYSCWMAEIYALIGERDAALEWVERAIARGFVNYPYFARHNRLLDSLRGDPRFEELLERCRRDWERPDA